MAASFLDELLRSPVDPNPPLDGQKSAFPSIPSHQQGANMAQAVTAVLPGQIGQPQMIAANQGTSPQRLNSVQNARVVQQSNDDSPSAMLTRVLNRPVATPAAAASTTGPRQPVPIAPRPAAQLRAPGNVASSMVLQGGNVQGLATPPQQIVAGSSVPLNGQGGGSGIGGVATAVSAQETPSFKVKQFLNNLVVIANKTSSDSGAKVTELVKQLVSGALSEELFVQQMGESQSGSTGELLALLKSGVPQLRNELKALEERTRQQQQQKQHHQQALLSASPQTIQTTQIVQAAAKPGVQQQQAPQQQQSPQYVHVKTTGGQIVAVSAQVFQQLQQQQQQQLVPTSMPTVVVSTPPTVAVTAAKLPLQIKPEGIAQQLQKQPTALQTSFYSPSGIQQQTPPKPVSIQSKSNSGSPVPAKAGKKAVAPASSSVSKGGLPGGGTKGKQKATGSGAAGTFSSGDAGPVRMDDDDITDVTSMAGVNLLEETARISATNSELVTGATRSIKEELFLVQDQTEKYLAKEIFPQSGIESVSPDVCSLLSHAVEEYLKDFVEKMAVISQHRLEMHKEEPSCESISDVKAQLKVFERIDQIHAKRKQERERELLLKAAKSRSKQDDAELAFLKEKAKQMQQEEDEILRKRAANETALLAIGQRKRPKIDLQAAANAAQFGRLDGSDADALTGNPGGTALARVQARKTRLRRVNFKDLLFLLEQEQQTRKSLLLYKSYLK